MGQNKPTEQPHQQNEFLLTTTNMGQSKSTN
jgi:hypothetical protein